MDFNKLYILITSSLNWFALGQSLFSDNILQYPLSRKQQVLGILPLNLSLLLAILLILIHTESSPMGMVYWVILLAIFILFFKFKNKTFFTSESNLMTVLRLILCAASMYLVWKNF